MNIPLASLNWLLHQSSYRGYSSKSMKVGTKLLKNRLSYYLRRVRHGETVFVTDRGQVVAELRGIRPARRSEEEIVRELEAEGILTRGNGRGLTDFQPIRAKPGRTLSQIIIEDRG